MDSIHQHIYPSLVEACLMGLFDVPRENASFMHTRSSDTRGFFRIEGHFNVDLWVDGDLYRCITHNVSYGGMFIETSKTLSSGQKIFICMHLNHGLGLFCVKGEIIRNSPHGVGVRLFRG